MTMRFIFGMTVVALLVSTCQGQAKVENLSHDFGTVSADVHEFVFTLKNTAGKTINVLKKKTSCECISIAECPDSFAAGSRENVRVRLDLTKLHGYVNQEVLIVSDDPDTPVKRFKVTAMVEGVWADPQAIDFGNLSGLKSKEISILSAGFPEAKITKIDSATPLNITKSNAISDEKTGQTRIYPLSALNVSISPEKIDLGGGRSELSVWVSLGETNKKDIEIKIPVQFFKCGDGAVTSSLNFGMIPVNDRRKRTFAIKSKGKAKEFTATCDSKRVTISLEDSKNGIQLIVEMANDAKAKRGLLKSTVVVRRGKEKLFVIPLLAFLQ